MTEIVIGLHGLGGDSTAWASLARAVPDEMAVEGIDLPGFGSAATLGAQDVAGMRDHVVAELRRRGHATFWLLGQSMGAKIALAVARLAEDGDPALSGLQGLVLFAGSPPAPEPIDPGMRREMQGWLRGHPDDSRAQATRFVDDNAADRLPDSERDSAIAAVLRSHPDAWWAWLEHGLAEDWRDRIGILRMPALVMAGDADGALGPQAQAREMLPHLADARFVVLQGAAHLLHLERSAQLGALIASWWAERAAPPIEMPADRADYRALVASGRVSRQTRAVLEARAASVPPPAPPQAEACLGAVAAWCLPGVATAKLVRAAWAATQAGPGDGWRFAVLPPDAQAWTEGVVALDRRAGGVLAALPVARRDALLAGIADEDPAVSPEAAFLADVQAMLTRLHVAQPQTLAALGYGGIAYGGDTPRLPGFPAIGAGTVEPWEPREGSLWR